MKASGNNWTKKILRVLLALTLVAGMGATAFAEEQDYHTNVTYDAAKDAENPVSESYTVTVPAEMVPGETATVKATGTWAANRKLDVSAPTSVDLANSIDGGVKNLGVTFAGIAQVGSNTEAIDVSESITVAEISNALFGTWSGTLNYTVAMGDAQ